MTRRDRMTSDMFQVPMPADPLPGSMDYRAEIAHLVGEALKGADGDRYAVAAAMSRLTGHDVSKYMLDAWSSEARDSYNMPFYQAPVLESACNTLILSSWLAEKRGGRLLVGKDALAAELAKLERAKEQAAKQIRELKRLMGDIE